MLQFTLRIDVQFEHFKQSANKRSQMCQSKSYIAPAQFNKKDSIMLEIRAATIQLPHDTIRITIFASRYDTYRDTFLTTLEPWK